MTIIYQFQKLDICTGAWRTSRRWGTRSAIRGLGDHFRILAETATRVEDIDEWSEIPGLTVIGFVPPRSKSQPIEQRNTKDRADESTHALTNSLLAQARVLAAHITAASAAMLWPLVKSQFVEPRSDTQLAPSEH